MADAKDPKKGKGGGGKAAGKPAKKEGGKAPQMLDDGSQESKFQPRLRDAYRDRVVPALMKEFGYKNIMQVPKLERIVLNVGMSEAIQTSSCSKAPRPNWARSPDRRRWSPGRRRPSQALNFGRACRSARRSRCGTGACMNFATVW